MGAMDAQDVIVKTNVIKRNGQEVDFHEEKIIGAIEAANKEVADIHRMNKYQIRAVADERLSGTGCGG